MYETAHRSPDTLKYMRSMGVNHFGDIRSQNRQFGQSDVSQGIKKASSD